jgi:RNA polymerase sigma-70 factor (ECF subfamily)
VFDYSVQETAVALGITEASVKTTHHRARRAMRDYDQRRCIPTRQLQERTRQTLERFLSCLLTRDVMGLETLLAADVRAINDGGGEFLANLKTVRGREKLTRFYLKQIEEQRTLAWSDIRLLNGLPTLVVEFADQRDRQAQRFVQQCLIDEKGQITVCYAILASPKLTAVRFASPAD